jgi:carbonic anhydrase/acetyltransferase-like protein (isoleucine patch superfamily)
MAGSITEHRDLIHPAAELRGDVKVNDARASMMVMFMQVVVTDLADPSTEAKIAAYVAK